MRTSRLGRWLIGGALIAAGVVAAHGGQAGATGGAHTLSCESVQGSGSADEQVSSQSDVQYVATEGYDWG